MKLLSCLIFLMSHLVVSAHENFDPNQVMQLNEDQLLVLEEYLDELLKSLGQEMCHQKPVTSLEKLKRTKRGFFTAIGKVFGCGGSVGVSSQQHARTDVQSLIDGLLEHNTTTQNPSPTPPHVAPSFKPRAWPSDSCVNGDPCTCNWTRNLTESWRNIDRNESKVEEDSMHEKSFRSHKSNLSCDSDLQNGSNWFRFTGAAGQMLANRCPEKTCGGHGSFWSDDEMPKQIGLEKDVLIYGNYDKNCARYKWPLEKSMKVIRCSEAPGDFIYKVLGTESCFWTFCGVNVEDTL